MRGMSDSDVRDLISGRRTIPGMEGEDAPWTYDGPKFTIKGFKTKEEGRDASKRREH